MSGNFVQVFQKGKVTRSSGFCAPDESEDTCKEPPVKSKGLPDSLCKIVTNVCLAKDPDTNKYWMVQYCEVWDEQKGCWFSSSEGVYELPALYGAGSTLPSFDGFVDGFLDTGDVARLYGGAEIPDNFVGSVLCINGTVAYVGNQPIQAEIQLEGGKPADDSGIKLWVDCGIAKVPAGNGDWVQIKPFGDVA